MDVNDNPDIEFPAVSVVDLASRARRRPSSRPRSPSASRPRSAASTASTRSPRASARAPRSPSSIFDIGVPVDRAVNDVRNAVAQVRCEPARRHPRAAGAARERRERRRRSLIISAEATDMTLEQLSWYVDNIVVAATARRSRAWPRSTAAAASAARSASSSIRPSCSRYGVTAAQVNNQLRADQHQRRRRPRPDRRLRAVGARARQRPGRLSGSASTQIAVGGGRTVRLSDIADVRDRYAEQRSLAMMNGRQVLSFGLSASRRARRTSPSSTRRRRCSQQLERENPKVHFTHALQRRRLYQEPVQVGDGGADRGRRARGARRASCSCATGARR